MVHGVDEHGCFGDVLFFEIFTQSILDQHATPSTNMSDEDETNDTNVET